MKFYNTRTRQKEDFTPLEDGKAGIYTCGPTVYNHAHIGNMRAYVFADLLRRALEHAGYDVNHVMNITDVGHLTSDADSGEDKMEVGKQREGLDAWGIAAKYTRSFFEHTKKLHILTPNTVCKATDHIAEQIRLVQRLEAKDLTYITEDGVYFDTAKFSRYGEMARLDIEGLESGKRIAEAAKKNKTDFALWKFSPAGGKRDMEWHSPWGMGFPGWHIECSAMAMHYLGEQFDIHTGGIDHIQIHHTNEIAQSEGATDKTPFVNVWLHCEFLQFGESAKMSKSKGEVLTVDALIERGYDPLAFRYLCLTAHYRSPLKFSWKALDAAQTALKRLRIEALKIKHETGSKADMPLSPAATAYHEKFAAALADDLNSAVALAALHGLLSDKTVTATEKMALLVEFEAVLHLGLFTEEQREAVPEDVTAFAAARQTARKNKDWVESDRLRDEIAARGYTVKDTAGGFELIKS